MGKVSSERNAQSCGIQVLRVFSFINSVWIFCFYLTVAFISFGILHIADKQNQASTSSDDISKMIFGGLCIILAAFECIYFYSLITLSYLTIAFYYRITQCVILAISCVLSIVLVTGLAFIAVFNLIFLIIDVALVNTLKKGK